MSGVSRTLLGSYHGVPFQNVSVIPHGVPVMAPTTRTAAKGVFGWGNRTVLLTHGLIHQVRGAGPAAVLSLECSCGAEVC
jgi:hypothetical protein